MKNITYKQTQYINQIAEIHESELERQYADYRKSKLSVALRVEMIEHGLRNSDDNILIKTNHEQLIGFIWSRYDKVQKLATIEMLYVEPSHRKLGIATILKKEIEAWAMNKGARKIESTVAYSNRKIQELNLNMGYNKDKIIMSKNLLVNNEDNIKQ
ncbi:GNAT family N-acetyltransferase [Staphylococcus edaphicus]|uniref:GNAT family N-acetyltransferase n=1 Tax=Staphylococcus edaphicus TaxID=1955013 RepID=A0A2C6WPV3_9STAP|nr:GNAT family N-acetyltransferase [Staphylococcus edaphicus]PHK50419.1 GNAT family N-acetyltransferase [Staphylococcus edaphicus]UQW81104.1 GNAT family N-acetyltransferase [Staphylococcus edaphicus]